MRKALARWLRGVAQRLDPKPRTRTQTLNVYFGEPTTTTTANTFTSNLRRHIENKG